MVFSSSRFRVKSVLENVQYVHKYKNMLCKDKFARTVRRFLLASSVLIIITLTLVQLRDSNSTARLATLRGV